MHSDRCKNCPCIEGCSITRKRTRADIAVVFDQPTAEQLKKDEWLPRKRRQPGLFEAMLDALDVDPNDIYFCSALNCAPDQKKKTVVKNGMLACRERLIDELREAGVKKVLSVGPVAHNALTGGTKLQAITSIRGKWYHAFGMDIMSTFPLKFVYADADYFRDLARDVEKFFTTDGALPAPDVTMERPTNAAEVKAAFKNLAQYSSISCDIETTDLSIVKGDLHSIGFAYLEDDGTAGGVILDSKVLKLKGTWRAINERLQDPEQDVVFHNAKFDLQFLRREILKRCLTWAPQSIQDTMLMNYTLDERPKGKFQVHGLKAIARVRYDAPDYDINMKKFNTAWRGQLTPERRAEMYESLLNYMAVDCYYTIRLFFDLWDEILAETAEDGIDLMSMYSTLLMPGTLALTEIESRGIQLDLDMYRRTREELGEKSAALLQKIRDHVGDPEFNPGSPKQVEHYIYKVLKLPFGMTTDRDGNVYHTVRRGKLREGATAAPVLKSLGHKYPEHKPIIEDICEHRNLSKNIGTYVVGLLDRVDPDGRLRTSLNLHGTATGRLSSSGPNLQNVPDASHTGIEIRAGFVASPGHVLIEADYKQLEVRIAAWLAGDEAMKEVFKGDRDPHQEIAFSIYRKPKDEITHYMRWLAKNILFGLLYGRGYASVATGPEQEDIVARGGKRWDVDDVKKFYDQLLAEWADFAQWQQDQKALGYERQFVYTPTGRKKRFPFIPPQDAGYVGRASFNNPIQGTASDFTLDALIKLHARLPEGAYVVLTVHDSIMIECPEGMADDVEELIRVTMEEDTLFKLDVPLKVDIDVSQRWGEEEFAKQHVPIAEVENAETED